MRQLAKVFIPLICLLVISSPILAHHGVSRYDLTKTIDLNGTVTSFDWSNPHCLIHLDAKGDNGNTQHWTLELASMLTMSRKGWTKDSLKLGDQVEVETHPARNGTPIGLSGAGEYLGKVVANGKTLPNR